MWNYYLNVILIEAIVFLRSNPNLLSLVSSQKFLLKGIFISDTQNFCQDHGWHKFYDFFSFYFYTILCMSIHGKIH